MRRLPAVALPLLSVGSACGDAGEEPAGISAVAAVYPLAGGDPHASEDGQERGEGHDDHAEAGFSTLVRDQAAQFARALGC